MGLLTPIPWLAVGAFAGGAAAAVLVAYLYQYRGRPGADWLMLAIGVQAVWGVTHGIALLTADTGVRLLLEAIIWVAISWIGFLFLLFGLEYTGRGDVVRSRWMAIPVLFSAGITVLALTNGTDGLVWTGFEVVRAHGVAAVEYDLGPAGYAMAVVGNAYALVGVTLLVDAILSYGPLYRREAAAVAFSTVPVAGALLLWVLDVGPLEPVNLVTVAFIPHALLDAYAFVGTNMFESNPTTLRAANQSAIDGLGTPVLILDPEDRIVEANAAAAALLSAGADAPDLRGQPVTAVVDGFDDDTTVVLRDGGEWREFAVSASSLTEPDGAVVGRTVVMQDVTESKRREQRLEVLNRILRHNLRNEMAVVGIHADVLTERLEDDDLRASAATITARSDELVSVAEKARTFERAIGHERSVETVALSDLFCEVADTVTDRFPAGEVKIAAGGHVVRTDRELLRLALVNLVENGLEHGDADAPWVSVSATARDGHGPADRRRIGVETGPSESGRDQRTLWHVSGPAERDGGVEIAVRDDGPGIPETELETLRAGTEQPLQHGQGIGLWVVKWCVDALGGGLAFATGDDGSVVTVWLPDAGE